MALCCLIYRTDIIFQERKITRSTQGASILPCECAQVWCRVRGKNTGKGGRVKRLNRLPCRATGTLRFQQGVLTWNASLLRRISCLFLGLIVINGAERVCSEMPLRTHWCPRARRGGGARGGGERERERRSFQPLSTTHWRGGYRK